MQDKDFDRLFSDRLGNLEVEPSREVWKGISAQLDQSKRKPLGVYLSIAATMLMMLTVGVYSLTRDEQAKPKQQVAVVKPKVKEPEPVEAKVGETKVEQKQQPVIAANIAETTIAKAKQVRAHKQVEKALAPIAKPEEVTQPEVNEPVLAANPNEQLAQLPVQKAPAIKFTVPDKSVPLIEKIDEPVAVNAASLANTAEQQPSKTLAAAPVRKHKIRGIGDLLNAVVSKIDKRKDKLIEFSSKDEDEPNVTGLNLGFIKIKKQSR